MKCPKCNHDFIGSAMEAFELDNRSDHEIMWTRKFLAMKNMARDLVEDVESFAWQGSQFACKILELNKLIQEIPCEEENHDEKRRK